MSEEPRLQNSLVRHQTEDGDTRIGCRFYHDTLWLTQARIAELFRNTCQNVTLHLKAIFAEVELTAEATCKEYLQVRKKGKREVSCGLVDGLDSVYREALKMIAAERYDDFVAKRRKQEAIEADAEDLKAIEDLEKDLNRKGGRA
jgi:hypothetical protein